MPRHAFAIAAILAAAVLWGSTGTIQAMLPEDRVPVAVGAVRLLIGAAALLSLALLRPGTRAALCRLPWRGVIFAGLAICGYNLLFFWAVALTGVGVGTAITIGSAPIWTSLYEILVAGHRPGRQVLVGQAASIAGVAILVTAGGGGDAASLGIGLALAAGGSYAAYSLITSRIGSRAPSVSIAAATFSVAALAALPVLLIVPMGWLEGATPWTAMVFLGVGATGLSYALYTWGLFQVAASTAVTLALVEPLTAWLLATLVVDEPVTFASITGAALIFAGLVAVTTGTTRSRE